MATKPTTGSITQTADAQKDRINNISNVSSAINAMQKDVDQKISETNKRVDKKEDVQLVQSAMTQTLSKVNQTIGALATGVTRITADTAKATAGAINQYGKAISEDISFNKKSVVAMALAKTSPIYGYFVSKFMETNVWKQALTKMKTSIMQTMGAILRPFKGSPQSRSAPPQAPQAQGSYPGQGLGKVKADGLGGGSGGLGGGAGIGELISIQRQQLDFMEKSFGQEQKYYKSWFERMSPMRVVRAFRRSKGNYTTLLSTSNRPLINISENIATLYTQLMWRMDRLLEIQKANVIANRDLTTHVTGKKYPEIPGIRLRQLVKPFVRKLLSGAMKALPYAAMAGLGAAGAAGTMGVLPAVGGMAAIHGMMRGKKKLQQRDERKRLEAEERGETYKGGFLTKRRGLYKDFTPPSGGGVKGFFKRRFRGMFPDQRQMEMGGSEPGSIFGMEHLRGTGGGGRGGFLSKAMPSPLSFTGDKKRQAIEMGKALGIGYITTIGGRRGKKKPLWVQSAAQKKEIQYYKDSSKQDKVQTKAMKQIKESNRDQYDLQKKAYKRAGKWRLMDMIMKGFSWVGGIFGKIFGFIGDMIKNILSSKAVWAALAAALVGVGIGNWIDNKWFKPAREKWNKFIAEIRDTTNKKILDIQTSTAQEFVKTLETSPLAKKLYEPKMTGKMRKARERALDAPASIRTKTQEMILGKTLGRGYERIFGRQFSNLGGANYADPTKFAPEIFEGQRNYRNEKINQYTSYHPDEVSKWRYKFNEDDIFRGVKPGEFGTADKPNLQAIKNYGSEKEAAFLEYLRKKATKMTESQRKKVFWEEKRKQEAKRRGLLLEESTGLNEQKGAGTATDSPTGKVNQAVLTKQDSETIEKQAELTSSPVVNKLDDVEATIKDESGKSTVKLQTTAIQNTNQINTSINDTTSISGGGRQREGMGSDGWHQRAIFSGGR